MPHNFQMDFGLANRVRTSRALHWFLSLVIPSSGRLSYLSIASLVFLMVLSHLLFPFKKYFVYLLFSFFCTWPSHLNLLLFTKAIMSGSSYGIVNSLFFVIRHSPFSWVHAKVLINMLFPKSPQFLFTLFCQYPYFCSI